MEVIQRPLYMKRILSMMDKEFIKIITGVRRAGKSYILLMIKDELLRRGINEQQIIYLNFENPEYFDILSFDKLYQYIKEKVPQNNKKVYFLFDEIQEVTEWQKLVNGLRVAYDSDIYITGSNASILSGELATYLTGRYVEIKVQPLTLNEYLKFKNYDDSAERHFDDYLEYGGFPAVVLQTNNQLKNDVLKGIFNSVLLRDVTQRATIKNPEALERIALFLLSNIGQLVSVNRVANTLRSSGLKVSNNTIEGYLKLLEEAYLFYKVPRYDIRGKEYLRGQGKYYVVDLGFVRSQLRRNGMNRGSMIENLVFLKLLSEGYEVFVGKYDRKEIDFVATNSDETVYLQVTDHVPDNSKRETNNLLHLPTGYRKILITNSWNDVGEIDGIPVIHLIDFLTKGIN